jgi:hypothetical protein
MVEIIPCPRCERKLRVPAEHLGDQVCCPSCRHVFTAEVILTAVPLPEEVSGRERRADPPAPARAPQRGEGPAPPRQRPAGTPRVLVGVAILLLLFVGGGIVAFLILGGREAPRPGRQVPSPPALGDQGGQAKALTEAQAQREAQHLLDGLGQALRDRDDERIADHFHLSEMIKVMAAKHPIPGEGFPGQPPLPRRLRQKLAPSLRELDERFRWEVAQIVSVRVVSETEMVVVARLRTPKEAGSHKIRSRMVRQSGTWGVVEMEWLDLGFRLSDVLATATSEDEAKGASIRKAMAVLIKALWAALVREKPAEAEALLAQLPPGPRTGEVEAARLIVTAGVHLQRKRYQEALDTLRAACNRNPGVPYLDFIGGMALNRLARGEEAFQRLNAYHALVGDDDQLCCEIGLALRQQQLFKEAAIAYRSALNCNSKNAIAFQGLILSLAPGDFKGDLADRFGKLDHKHSNFDIFVGDTVNRDRESLELLAQAMSEADPTYPPPWYHLALIRVEAGQAPEGIARMQTALKWERKAEKRAEYLRGFVEAMFKAGKLDQARAVMADEFEAFRFLAPELARNFRRDDLFALVAAHGKRHGSDPLLPLFQAALLAQGGHYALVADAFRRGLTQLPPADVLAAVRSERVLARYHTAGAAAAIYREIGPADETFRQVAWLCWSDRNNEGLQALLDAHAKNNPDDLLLARFRTRLNIRQNEVPTAIGQFKELAAKLDDKERAALRSELYRADHAEDPLLAVYQGELHLKDGAPQKAADVLGAALGKARGPVRERLCRQYVHAMHQVGRDREALTTALAAGLGRVAFSDLAGRLADEKKGADLEALIAVYRPQAGGDVELLFFDGKARLLAGKTTEGIRLLQEAYSKQTVPHRRTTYLRALVVDPAAAGGGFKGYEAAPDKPAAFRMLADWLLGQKKLAELEKLLDEDGGAQAGKALHRWYTGQLQMQRGKLEQAAQSFAAGLASAAPTERSRFQSALTQARVRDGKATAAYRELGQDQRAFDEVARVCLTEKNADQLAALIALNRQDQPDDPQGPRWELELLRLRQDHAGVLRLLTEQRLLLCMNPRSSWQYSGWLVRTLVKLNRPQEALKEAEAPGRPSRDQPLLLILAQAALGDVTKTIAVLEKHRSDEDLLADCYADEDLGPILRSDSFKPFRDRFPDPDE